MGTLVVGNTAVQQSAELWEWRVFVQAAEHAPLIERVTMQLHPTFVPSQYNYDTPASDGTFCSRAFTGWGTFQVGVSIQWRDGTTSEVKHGLVFNDNGGVQAEVEVTLPSVAFETSAAGPAMLRASMDHDDGAPRNDGVPLVSRDEIRERLVAVPHLEHTDAHFFHGRAYSGPHADQEPERTWESKSKPRSDHGSNAEWLEATEFRDHEAAIDAKCSQLARLLQLSNKTVIYSGAGISVAACIGQAAVGSGGEGSKGLDALPTKTHFALGALAKAGLVHGWVQQNHDGLPQKAGFPQESINEIHGSWFDPSNPVVLYSGSLKKDCYPWMRRDADTADLVIVVGTSLGGLNADQVATKTAHRSTKDMDWCEHGTGGALGSVIINLQQTEQDGNATLRMFGTTDEILPRVLVKLGLAEVTKCNCGGYFCRERNGYMYRERTYHQEAHHWDLLLPGPNGTMVGTKSVLPTYLSDDEPVVIVPYDREGKRSETAQMRLNLSKGQRVKITKGHNITGAGQPAYMHIGADKPYTRPPAYGGQTMNPGPGHGFVKRRLESHGCFELVIEGVVMELGVWWLDAAKRGALKQLPVVNIDPVMENE